MDFGGKEFWKIPSPGPVPGLAMLGAKPGTGPGEGILENSAWTRMGCEAGPCRDRGQARVKKFYWDYRGQLTKTCNFHIFGRFGVPPGAGEGDRIWSFSRGPNGSDEIIFEAAPVTHLPTRHHAPHHTPPDPT